MSSCHGVKVHAGTQFYFSIDLDCTSAFRDVEILRLTEILQLSTLDLDVHRVDWLFQTPERDVSSHNIGH